MTLPWASGAAGLSFASAPVHVWLLFTHRHSAVMAAALCLMTAACALCAVHSLRSRAGNKTPGLRGLLVMADAMAITHSLMLFSPGGAGHGHHGSHGPLVLSASPNTESTGVSLLLLVGLELAAAMCAALALRSRRRTLA
ncbi:hypothetical protein [Kocuria palustris]|uniref:hypothetical protein n=1 Tax=Kocuria palustris TaxID=71999 RepID=UPI0011A4CF5F|nr:hypothetical protein [Kocuria palustris]